jgi:hypothetical protein
VEETKMSYGVQSGCRVECGYKSLEEAIDAIKSELTQYCRPTDDSLMVWEDPITGRHLRITWIEDDEKDTLQ